MPITLIATPGAPTANTCVTLDEYKAYILTRLPVMAWTAGAAGGAIDDLLSVSLIAGARLMPTFFSFTGAKTYAAQLQSQPAPRTGWTADGVAIDSMTIPTRYKDAQCEMSLAVGAGDLLADDDAAKKNVSSVKAGSVEVHFQSTGSTLDAVDAAIRRLQPKFAYLSAPDAVRLMLDPSWYVQATVKSQGLLSFAGPYDGERRRGSWMNWHD